MSLADVHFAIGKTHRICQDYGVAGRASPASINPLCYAIISDGCSSSPDTDFGARLLCKAAEQACLSSPGDVFRGRGLQLNPDRVIQTAAAWGQELGLHDDAIDATLLIVTGTQTLDAEVYVYGDGIVAARRRDGTGYDYFVVECTRNAPSYLSYLLDPQRLRVFQEQTGGARRVTYYDADGSKPTVMDDTAWKYIDVDPATDLDEAAVIATFNRAAFDVVAVISDGASSFQRREGTRFVSVPLREVLDHVMDFKVLTPGFVQRRVGKFLSSFCPRRDWQHNDDLAVGAIVLDPPEDDENRGESVERAMQAVEADSHLFDQFPKLKDD